MSHQSILFEISDGVARLTLNRPERLNSFNVHDAHGGARACSRSCADELERARVLVLTGAGRGFCAGQDLGDRAVAPGGRRADLGESIEKYYKPLVLALTETCPCRSLQRSTASRRARARTSRWPAIW